VKRWRAGVVRSREALLKTLIALLAWIAAAALPGVAQATDNAKTHVAELNYFVGRWQCAGTFASSGAKIEANLEFESILDSHFILFRHDDKPPHKYHAWSEWGWDNDAHQFIASVQDSFAGATRLFRADAWKEDELVWQGGSAGEEADQQFVFKRLSAKQFRVSYATRKNGAWNTVDDSVCSRIED
jgi:hypothetical protein